MKYALWIIAVCHILTTFDLYETEEGGWTVFAGNFGYYFAQGETE